MRKFTFSFKTLLLLASMLIGGGNYAWAQVVSWTNTGSASYTANQELSPNTGIVSVKLGNGTWTNWESSNGVFVNDGNYRTPTFTEGIPTAGGYLVITPVRTLNFSLYAWCSGGNCNVVMIESSAPATELKDFRKKSNQTLDFGTLEAGKTYYIYGRDFKNSNWTDYLGFKSFTATTYEDCTINYKFESSIIKSEIINELIGQSVSATMSSMWDDGETTKYFVDEGATTSFTVAASGNIFDVTLRKANTAAVTTVNAAVGGEVIKSGIQITYSDFSGTNVGVEGESTKVYYPAYVNVGGKYYKATKNDAVPYYGVSTVYGANVDIVYTLDETIAYYSEVEDLTETKLSGAGWDGFRDNIKNTSADRFSGTTPRFYGNHYAYTEPLSNGIYNVSIYARNSRNADGETLGANIKIRKPDGSLVDTGIAFPSWNKGETNTKTAEGIAVPEGASLVIAAGSSNSNIHMDFIYMERTGNFGVELTSSANLQGWKTFYDENNNYEVDANTTIYKAAAPSANASTITLTPVEGNIVPKQTPVILKTSDDVNYEITLTATTTASEDVFTGNALTYKAEEGAVSRAYVLGYLPGDGNGLGFYSYTASLPAGTIYVTVPSEAKSLRIVVDGQTTDVVAPEVAEKEEPEVLYNMSGQIVGKDYKGFVINQKGEKRLQK